jgi:hypothetical protein
MAVGMVAVAAHAQGREKLEAPGKVAFGTSYAQAEKILGAGGKAMPKDDLNASFKRPNARGLSCENCSVPGMPNIEGVTLYFSNDRLVRVEHFAMFGTAKSLDHCAKLDTGEFLPALTKQYGAPGGRRNTKGGGESHLVASFPFKDGGLIEYDATFLHEFGACSFTIRYMSKDGR